MLQLETAEEVSLFDSRNRLSLLGFLVKLESKTRKLIFLFSFFPTKVTAWSVMCGVCLFVYVESLKKEVAINTVLYFFLFLFWAETTASTTAVNKNKPAEKGFQEDGWRGPEQKKEKDLRHGIVNGGILQQKRRED